MLLISHDVVGRTMAGPGIRYYHMAHTLARHTELTFAVPQRPDAPSGAEMEWPGFRTVEYVAGRWPTIESAARRAEVIVLPSDIAHVFPQLADLEAAFVIDGYDPLLAEWLMTNNSGPLAQQHEHWWQRMQVLNRQYLLGDFFMCASERQRDWWLGLLEANGRINPWTMQEDTSLRRLVDVVAYGLSEAVPERTRRAIKGVWPGIGPHDRVILWGGGLWPWLDPLTAIRALALVWEERQDVRLIFPGTVHPNPMLAEIPSHNRPARALAAELGLLERGVFFGGWMPYADWANVLLESDVALSLHYDTLETRLAFRSRVLEYIWAGLPTVATCGDATGQLIQEHGLGVVVDYEDVAGVAQAILRLLDTSSDSLAPCFQRARQELRWEKVMRPLIEFCRHPRRAPDRAALGEQVGNPFYLEAGRRLARENARLAQENAYLQAESGRRQALVQAYERGRFMRFMRWVDRLKRRIGVKRDA